MNVSDHFRECLEVLRGKREPPAPDVFRSLVAREMARAEARRKPNKQREMPL